VLRRVIELSGGLLILMCSFLSFLNSNTRILYNNGLNLSEINIDGWMDSVRRNSALYPSVNNDIMAL